MQRISSLVAYVLMILIAAVVNAAEGESPPPKYQQVGKFLQKYCASCHNDDDREGGLSLETYASIFKGGEHGSVVTPRRGDLSRLVRVLTGQSKPAMPPDDSERPTPEDIAVPKSWIDAGAKGPEGGELDPTTLITPDIKPTAAVRNAVNAMAISARGVVATARYGTVTLDLPNGAGTRALTGHRGNVNAVTFSADGSQLVASAGEAGLFGEARVWNVADGKLINNFVGHKDSLFAAELSPDGKLLATGSYDRTIKLWNVATGKRLDTLGQSLKELYTLAFSPNGRRLAAGSVDNRIRVWRISETGAEGTNTLLFSRFAHEAAILRLAFSGDGRTLVSSGDDRLIKVWNARHMRLRATLEVQPDWATGLAISNDGKTLLAGRLDGTSGKYPLAQSGASEVAETKPISDALDIANAPGQANGELPKVAETEANDDVQHATTLQAPGTATGVIVSKNDADCLDVDLFHFAAKKGEQWILEINAARNKSPLDSKIEVLHADGRPVQRVPLRAVRDSEITFRGINSEQLNCRLTHWEEMELNELVYINGEVVKLYPAPRGPDSGFNFYPNTGKRIGYFDTSAISHPLGQPCYIVQPFAPGTKLPDNGLPRFPVYIENDDDAERRLGKDSRLTVVAPADADYFVRVTDVRGFSGKDFNYELTVRRPRPDFKVTLGGADPKVNAGSGKSFAVKAERIDNYNGPIRVDIKGLPPGFSVTTPIVIQAGQIEAQGSISAHPDAPKPTEANWSKAKVTASAKIAGKEVTHDVNNLGKIRLEPKPKLSAYLALNDQQTQFPKRDENANDWQSPKTPELTIAPGSSITCTLRVERNGFDGRIQFDVNNLPHGVIVDDIGLNGVLIPEGRTQRTIFLKAASP